MREEHRELLTSKEEQQKIPEEQAKAEVAVEKKNKPAFISVAMGEGITHVLKRFRCWIMLLKVVKQ